ncbi:hypothetical protein HBH56_053050 [Parastagonospora nodorum]|uniref:Heme haloperoxidase family profile domain-containing protein n=2 Tax=Phaeosphaeria nodorum (strain SN15 / ATCC MYA-4574 / FGSC 10173) TaxID=321614 RepID=A0A7U2I6Y0_PHANO|nr:hypothetical protein SNOG_05198 [Parastagonospora nodorum SN15]KAH3917153.1 hypothetical protein HBH56_053050 [Parastagonospora nodorum]EAT87589.2 hypothetical protein SNOG_05198 [Parastagonospora nodorum SN15]KAH3935699.1 hypothetical protein HBH54_038850 [Parastagonospora nodorum]KAH4067290.1 hypothetical protein HBH50_138160 [Parastagonospora nodorum]KAH4085057.1 hypothetical protein HBH48_155780 [Parastagonospora nodorum]
MKVSSVLSFSSIFASALAFPTYGNVNARQTWQPRNWTAPGPNDARGPCPGMNTLANHGYLPHNGRKITRDILADAMLSGFNIAKSDAIILFSQAVRTNPEPFARTFDLDTLGREGVLEHDFSLSRSDRFFANPLPFNETVWAETASFFKTPEITIQQLADARMARLETSKRTNPQHKTSALADGFSWGECASFFEIMADGTTGTVRKDFIEYWLRNERMPTEIGWTRRPTVMETSERTKFTRALMDAAGQGTGLSLSS